MNGITNIEYNLDWYDIQARQYDAIGVLGWNAIDHDKVPGGYYYYNGTTTLERFIKQYLYHK